VEQAASYLPVIMMHGFDGHASDWNTILQFIKAAHPGQAVFPLSLYSGLASLTHTMDEQLRALEAAVRNLTAHAPEFAASGGRYHLMGHSQGGLLTRALLQDMDDHNVVSYVSLSGPQMGISEIPPGYDHWLPAGLRNGSFAHGVMYSTLAQETLSFPGYWYDPNHYAEYLARSSFLTGIVGQVNASANGARYRANLLRVNASVFVGGPDDGVIGPWQSAHFGAVPPGSHNESDIVAMRAQPTYASDAVGPSEGCTRNSK